MADDAAFPPLSPAVPQPAHVPDHLVYDFDVFADAAMIVDAHARFLDIATHAPPIFWTPRDGGNWVFASHEAAFEGSRDWETFTSSQLVPDAEKDAVRAAAAADAPHIPQLAPITVDPPVHGMYRLPLNSVFSPKAMNRLTDDVRGLARELIATIAPAGRCDFMTAVAEPLPVQVFLKLLGLPLERAAEYRALVKRGKTNRSTDPQVAIRTFQTVAAIMRPTVEERRTAPRDDMISMLWRTELDGRPTTMEDLEDYGVMLYLAGLDTVMNGIGHGVHHLAKHPELQAQLRAEPARIADATEELLRRYTFTVPRRTVARDTVFQGVEMKKGDRVDILLPAADLDARHFEGPGVFDLDREDVHIAFGAGPHRCLGSHLARLELKILYEEVLAGLPPFALDPQRPVRFSGGHVIGPDALHLIWRP